MAHWIILLAHNGVEFTAKALPTLLAQDIPTRVLVIANAVDQGTSAFLEPLQRSGIVDVLPFPKQVSVARAWNDGISRAFSPAEMKPHVLVVNNDTELRPDVYSGLVKSGLPLVCSQGTVSHQDMNAPRENKFTPAGYDFSCFLMTQLCWNITGKFDEGFEGAFYEDDDYAIRAWRTGIRFGFIGVKHVHHMCGTLKASDPEEQSRIRHQSSVNMHRFLKMYEAHPRTPEFAALFAESEFGRSKKV